MNIPAHLLEPVQVFDHGFIRLVDCMGSDASIAETARVSIRTAKTRSDDRALLRTLMRERHTSPFEFAELIFHVRIPIFVARQWSRHRMANISEESARYSEVMDEILVPGFTEWRQQGTSNKQMSGASLVEGAEQATEIAEISTDQSYAHYKQLLDLGVSREQARIVLPVGTYTEWRWKIDLHNLLHFLSLRLASDAQHEIRVYAQEIARIVKELFPIIWEAFEDYRLNAVTFSGPEIRCIMNRVTLQHSDIYEDAYKMMSKREFQQFLEKLKSISG